jgi:dTDP-4-dehydrorhamnose reductase
MRILLLGASGYVGGVLYRALAAQHDVVGTGRRATPDAVVALDLADSPALADLARQGFDLVIHAAGVVDLALAEADPQGAIAVNAGSVAVLVDALAGTGGRIVLLSSDNVFDGTRDHYTETDPPGPINAYGRSKLAAEQALAADPRHVAVRLPLVYGASPWSARFMDRFAGAETPAQTDVVCAPIYLHAIPEALPQVWDLPGIVHLAGPEVVTRFGLMSRIAQALALPTRVVPVCNDDAFGGYRRPARLVLRSVRHEVVLPAVDEALAHMAAGS